MTPPASTLRRQLVWAWMGGVIASLLAILAGLTWGASDVAWRDVWHDLHGGDGSASTVILAIRAPRAAGAWLTGAALSLAGVLLQTATANPIADPYLVGTSGGATLAAVLLLPALLALGQAVGIDLGATLPWLQPACALLGALAALAVTLRLSRFGGGRATERVLLAGLVVSALCGALTSYLLTRASDRQLRAATQWLLGGVALPDLASALPLALGVAAGGLWSLSQAPRLAALQWGTASAHGIGIDTERLGRHTVRVASLLSAVAVSAAGLVGFVGLMVPHLLRRALGHDVRVLVPAALAWGGAVVTVLDLAARTVAAPAEVPLGILTALLGWPLLLQQLRPSDSAPRLAPQGSVAIDGRGLRANGLGVTAGAETLLHPFDCDWPRGELVVLVGPNGSGKSTLLAALAGIWNDGTPRQARGAVAWMPQSAIVPPGQTVTDSLALGLHPQLARDWNWRLRGILPPAVADQVRTTLDQLHLTPLASRRMYELSGGERQRVLVGMVAAGGAHVLLLDEPTAALDWRQSHRILGQLRDIASQQGRLVVVAVHDLGLASTLADRVVVLRAGRRVAEGPPMDPAVAAAVADVLGATWPQPHVLPTA